MNSSLPHFIYEMAMMEEETLNKCVLAKEMSEEGRYEVVINQHGKHQIITVDDFIPIVESTS